MTDEQALHSRAANAIQIAMQEFEARQFPMTEVQRRIFTHAFIEGSKYGVREAQTINNEVFAGVR